MTECLKNAASDAVTRRTGTVKAVIETVFRRHQLPCTVRVTEEGGVVDRFGLRAEPGVTFEAVAALAPELARELGVAAVRVTEYAIDRTFAGWGIENAAGVTPRRTNVRSRPIPPAGDLRRRAAPLRTKPAKRPMPRAAVPR